MAFSSDAESRRSPVAVSAFRPSRFFRLLVERTSRRRSDPCSDNARATWEPRNPVAPVRKANMIGSRQLAISVLRWVLAVSPVGLLLIANLLIAVPLHHLGIRRQRSQRKELAGGVRLQIK